MKFLLFLVAPLALNALQTFQNVDEFIKCIIDCEEHVSPCIKEEDSACQKVYKKCIDEKDPFTCFSSSNNIQINKIVQCMDSVCTPIEVRKVQEKEDDGEDDFEEIIIGGEEEEEEKKQQKEVIQEMKPATEQQKQVESVKGNYEHEKDYIEYDTPNEEDISEEAQEKAQEEAEEKSEQIEDLPSEN